jgi:hypothetical protein
MGGLFSKLVKSVKYNITNIGNNRVDSQQRTLNDALIELPVPPQEHYDLIRSLPIGHVTSARSYDKIVNSRTLQPQHCNVFNKSLLYFSYGGIFYSYGKHPTNNATELPIAFLFKPELLSNNINYLFPYDTGAAKPNGWWGGNGRYRNGDVNNFKKYQVVVNNNRHQVVVNNNRHQVVVNNNRHQVGLASKLVYYFYLENEKYMYGDVVKSLHNKINCNLLNEFPVLTDLHNFLKSDLCDNGVDYRQRAIECQSETDIELSELLTKIQWVGLPEDRKLPLRKLYDDNNIETLPEIYAYKYIKACPPETIISQLQQKARTVIEDIYINIK